MEVKVVAYKKNYISQSLYLPGTLESFSGFPGRNALILTARYTGSVKYIYFLNIFAQQTWCYVLRVTRSVSGVTFFFFFYKAAKLIHWWRVCYQRGLPRLVSP